MNSIYVLALRWTCMELICNHEKMNHTLINDKNIFFQPYWVALWVWNLFGIVLNFVLSQWLVNYRINLWLRGSLDLSTRWIEIISDLSLWAPGGLRDWFFILLAELLRSLSSRFSGMHWHRFDIRICTIFSQDLCFEQYSIGARSE